MSKTHIGINGFGRIGRSLLRQVLDRSDCEIVGINDLAPLDDLAYLLRYDSVHGRCKHEVRSEEGHLIVGDRRIPCSTHRDPAVIPWGDLGATVVIESTGVFRAREAAAAHLGEGVERVVISAPSKDADGTFVLGANADQYDPERHQVVSMASCTTNCLAPLAKVLLDRFGIEHMMMTTVHAYTASQGLLDKPARKRRRGRAAALSILPTTTGAALATAKVLPALEGKVDGMAVRVPVPDGSLVDATVRLETEVTEDSLLAALREASEQPEMKGVLRVSDDELVSADIVGDPHSSIIDGPATMVLGGEGRVAKLLSWYDNEWAYAGRLVDFAVRIG
ncbi:MAG: type I glyceraldehyde-3-phosphate dehydrogenase [Acidobacteriota bacterium]